MESEHPDRARTSQEGMGKAACLLLIGVSIHVPDSKLRKRVLLA